MTNPFKVGDIIKRVQGSLTVYKGKVIRIEGIYLHVRITEGDSVNHIGLIVYPDMNNCVLLHREQSLYSNLLKEKGSR